MIPSVVFARMAQGELAFKCASERAEWVDLPTKLG